MLLGGSAACHPVPAQGSREANNALLVARHINYHQMRLARAPQTAMVAIARGMVGDFCCHHTGRVLLKFPHQPGDNHDPGYRMTKILQPLSLALRSGPASASGVDHDAVSAICKDLAEFDDAHTTVDNARFLPIAKLVSFLKDFAHRSTEGA